MSFSTLRSLLVRGVPLALAACAIIATSAGSAFAQGSFPDDPDEAYGEWVDKYGDWTVEDAEEAGYTPTDECVAGPPDMGNMGRHFISISRFTSGKIDPEEPHVVLFDADDKIVGIEWEIDEVRDPAPMVGGLELEFTPPHEGMDYDHMSRHVYFVGAKEHHFSTFNPAVACPDIEMDEKDDDNVMADLDDDEANDGDDDRDEDMDDDKDEDPSSMPTTGFADGMPGGTLGLLAIVAVLMGALSVFGRRAESRLR